jgi:hypothetical protein
MPNTRKSSSTPNPIRILALGAGGAFAAFLFAGCLIGNSSSDDQAKQNKKGSTLQPTILTQMARLEPASLEAGAIVAQAKRSALQDTGLPVPHWSSDFSLASFKTPITRIVLEDTANGIYAEIYTCRSGNCLVELVGDQLEDVLGAVSTEIRPGTYTGVNFNYCQEGQSGYEALVTGEVMLNGETWYTQEGTSLTRESPATASRIRYAGCGRSFPLPRPVVIVADSASESGDSTALSEQAADSLIAEPLRFRLFFDLDGLVWAGLNQVGTRWAWAPGNCTGPHPDESPSDTAPFICAGYPDIAGTSDTVAPTLERYYLNGSSLFGLFFNSDGAFIGGYSRRYLVHGSSRVPGFEPVTPIRFFEALGGGVYHMGNYGSSAGSSYFETRDFRRGAHSGSFTGERDASGEYDASLTAPH